MNRDQLRALMTAVLLSQHFKKEWLPDNGKLKYKFAPIPKEDILLAVDAADEILKEFL